MKGEEKGKVGDGGERGRWSRVGEWEDLEERMKRLEMGDERQRRAERRRNIIIRDVKAEG